MKVMDAFAEIMSPIDGEAVLRHIELCGRVCYKSEGRITAASARRFVGNLIERGHESVLEHFSFTVRFVCDRGVSHEIVRHRIASFSQESTRYCNYGAGDGGCTFIRPIMFEKGSQRYREWVGAMERAERCYLDMLDAGAKPEEARSVLPNSLKTEVVMTANLREWRHFFRMRTAIAAHPQVREIASPLLGALKELVDVVFDDIQV